MLSCFVNAASVFFYPFYKTIRRCCYAVHAVRADLAPLYDAVVILCNLVLCFEYRSCMATAMWVPSCPLEVFGVSAFEVIADVSHRVVCVGRLNEYSDNEIHLLPTQMVGCPVSDIAFSDSDPASVFV